jgi:orotate phosphoribosyltransferase
MDIAKQTARILLDIGAVTVRPDNPFTLTSGRLSPVYVDCRRIISFPKERKLLMQSLADKMHPYASFSAVAGGETAGIPFAAWIADIWQLPMLYVRKKPKNFGQNAQIEGVLPVSGEVALIEDLATDGGSKKVFVDALRTAGSVCNHVGVVFHYGVFDDVLLKNLGVTLHALCTWWDVLEVLESEQRLLVKDIEVVRGYLVGLKDTNYS